MLHLVPQSTVTKGVKRMKEPTSRPAGQLFKSVRDFADFSAGLMVLADLAPERLTLSQAIFFLLTGTADIAGKDPTYTDIKEACGDKINKSLNTTYRIFLEPSRLYPNGLGWLTQEANPDDNRQKFLRLTSKGSRIMKEVLQALKGE